MIIVDSFTFTLRSAVHPSKAFLYVMKFPVNSAFSRSVQSLNAHLPSERSLFPIAFVAPSTAIFLSFLHPSNALFPIFDKLPFTVTVLSVG